MHGASDGAVDIGMMIAKRLFASAVETLLICAIAATTPIAATAQTKGSSRDKCPQHHDGGTKELSDLSAMAQATKRTCPPKLNQRKHMPINFS
jgi:hypothetical protein